VFVVSEGFCSYPVKFMQKMNVLSCSIGVHALNGVETRWWD
jgi:hypothetical protein